MPLIWSEETVRFEPKSDPGQWFDLKKELTSGDEDGAWDAAIAAAARDVSGGQVRFRPMVLKRERVRRAIAAWSYTTPDGEPAAITAENLDRLDPETFRELVEKVDEVLPPFRPARLPSLMLGSSPTSAATAARRRKA